MHTCVVNNQFSILGHTAQLQSLERDIQTGNIAHAYLFAGPRHVGKFTVAKWFAEKLLTQGITEADDFERVRHEMERLIHSDLFVLDKLWMEDVMEDPETIAKFSNIDQDHRRKAKAKTDTISIEDIRMLQERLHETGSGRFRCCLIRSIERMQAEGVNALLKILEEPPPGLVFLLTTESVGSILPTIVSRSRVLHFSPVAQQELARLVADVPREDAAFMLMIAQGAPGVIQELKEDPEKLRAARTLHTVAVGFWKSRTLGEKLKLLTPLEKRGKDAEDLLLHLSLALHQQKDMMSAERAVHLMELVRGFESNASRPLLVQRFVLEVMAQ